MENASKALIIAGAILLSILIISLGLMVYNQAKETVGSVNLTQQEIEAFNSKFTAYEGEKVSASKVNSLIQTVVASNQQAIDDSTGAYVCVLYPSKNSEGNSTKSVIAVSSHIPGGTTEVVFGVPIEEDTISIDKCVHEMLYNDIDAVVNFEGGKSILDTSSKNTFSVELKYSNGRVAGIDVK